jgi:hypothetical protein
MSEIVNILKDFMNISALPLLALILGYIGYWHAYHGEVEAKEDKYIKIAIFTLPSLLTFQLFSNILSESTYEDKFATYIAIIFISLLINIKVGTYWRTKGKNIYFKNNNINGTLNYKNHLPIINELVNNNDISITQIFVYLNDGTILRCNSIFNYENLSIGYLNTDPEKNLAIYVDERVSPSGEIEQIKEEYNKDEEWGNLITYIPYEQIKYIQFRTR